MRISGRKAFVVILPGAGTAQWTVSGCVGHNEVDELEVRFAASASRHGISQERARYVVEQCPAPIYPSAAGLRDVVLFLGPDRDGAPIEVAAIELVDGDLLVIHAMRMRRKYLAEFELVMRWHER